MELRQKLVNVPTRPIVLLVALFCAVAIALVGWYALSASTSHRVYSGTAYSDGGFPGPDARDRNDKIKESQNPEAHHGH